jgi:hypothetical protein
MGQISCTETSATNYELTLRNIAEEPRYHIVPLIHNLGTGWNLVASFKFEKLPPLYIAEKVGCSWQPVWIFFLGMGQWGQCRPKNFASVSQITTIPRLPVPSYLLKMRLRFILILSSLHKVCYLRSLLFRFSC